MKNYILDTHTFLWFLNADEQLSPQAKKIIQDIEVKKFISIASIWEICIKLNLGKLKIDVNLSQLKNEILVNDFELLPLDFEHIISLSTLENHHKDPFDRIIISQSIVEKLIIISKDSHFKLYQTASVLWD